MTATKTRAVPFALISLFVLLLATPSIGVAPSLDFPGQKPVLTGDGQIVCGPKSIAQKYLQAPYYILTVMLKGEDICSATEYMNFGEGYITPLYFISSSRKEIFSGNSTVYSADARASAVSSAKLGTYKLSLTYLESGLAKVESRLGLDDPSKLKARGYQFAIPAYLSMQGVYSNNGTAVAFDNTISKYFSANEVQGLKITFFPNSLDARFSIQPDQCSGVYLTKNITIFYPATNGVLSFLVDISGRESDDNTEAAPNGINIWNVDRLHFPDYNASSNLVQNPSFETGLRYWGYYSLNGSGYVLPLPYANTNLYALDPVVAHTGQHSLRVMALPFANPWPVVNTPVPYVAGENYTLSFYAKGSVASGLTFTVRGRGGRAAQPFGTATNSSSQAGTFAIGGEWQRYSCSFIALDKFISMFFNAGALGWTADRYVWIDDVQIEKGPMTAFKPTMHQMQLLSSARGNFLEYGQSPDFRLAIRSLPNTAGTVALFVEDFFFHTVLQQYYDFNTDADGKATIALSALDAKVTGAQLRGVFSVSATLQAAGDARPYKDYFRFSVMNFLENKHKNKNLYANMYCYGSGPAGGDGMEWARFFERERARGIGSDVMVDLTQERNRLLNEYGLELFGKSMITDWKNIYEAGHVVLTNVNVMLNPSAEDLAKYEGVCERSASNRPWMNGWHFVSEAAAGLQPLESHPEAYAKFNLATLRGVKRGNPNAQVLLDGGSYSILPSECKRMEGYIQAVKALDPSAIPQYHGIGGHYYCDIPESSDLDVNIDEYIKMLDRNGCTNYTIDMVEGGNYSAINIPSEGLTPYICMSANNWWIALPSYHIGKGERISAAFMARTWLVGLKYQDRVKHMAGYLTPNRKLDVDFTPTVFDKIPNTLGRLLGDASFYKDIRFAPFCRCYVFKDDTTGAPIAAVWGHKESVDRWKEDPPQVKFNFGGQAVQFIDLMENEVSFPNDADGKTVIPMSPFPIFIKGAVGTIDSLCQALSNAVTVSPNPAPAIAVQPQSLRGNPGTPASFTVTATGTSPLFYQWQKNTTNIPSATKQVYTIAAIALGDAGSYRCIVSNMAGQVTSAAATLTVHAPPAIAVQPRSLTNNPGTAASFTVTAAGTAPLFYQWQKNAIDINLATNAAYTIAAIALGDAGSYRCIVRNMAGQVTSAAATLSVNDAPTVSISSPANGTVFTAPAAITINANASDIDGSVTKVEFYNGATKIGEDTTSPYSFAWANVPPGSYTLTAKATDNGGAIRTSAPVTLTVMKVDQAITFAALADKTYGDAAFALTATASGGLPVSYASDNPSVATVSGSTVTIVGAGSAVITASQAGDGAYNAAANVSRTLTVSRKALTVKANNKSRLVGQANPSFDAAYTGLVGSDTSTSIGLTVAFACAANSESPAGTYPIEPSGAAFTANYTVTYQNGTLTVNAPEAITTIAVTPANALAPVRESRQFTAVAMDQFGNLLSPQPAFSWAVTAGGGTIDQAGLFTATNTVGMFTVTASSGGKSGAAQGHALIGSLVGWWLFDEINGTSAVDSSGFANNAALSGGATWLPIGQVYGAVRLDAGSNAQVGADNVAVDTASGATNTVYFWMKWDGGNDQMPFAWDNGYGLHLLDGALGITTGNGDILGIASTGLSNRWVHVAAVFPNGVPSATNAKIYIDGVEQALSMRMGTATQDRSATPRWCMSGVGGVSRFKGAVDDLRIWRMRLTAAQVARPVDPTLWLKLDETNGTIAADSSGYVGHNGMLVNGPVWTSGTVNGALNFDGINDYVVADTAGLNPKPGFYSTVAFWMKWNGGNYQMPFGWNGNYDLYLVNGSFGINTAEGNVLGISSEGLAGRWTHVAVVFPNGVPNAGNAKMYINGVLQALTNRIGMATLSRRAGSKGIISGWDTNATHKFGGAIDDLRVYPRELFAGEVTALARMGTNRAPVAVNDAYTAAEDTILTVAMPGVLGNDSDPDGEALTAAKVSDPAHGALVLNANGSFTFTPNADWNGTDTFSYRASDGKINSNTATVTITVTPVNDVPTVSITSPANGATFTVPATITINASASDMDGSVTKVEFYNGATRLGEDTTSPYSFAWATVPVGSYALTAKATDNSGAITASTLVTLTVAKAGQTIVFSALPSKTYGDAAFALTATASSGLPVSYASDNPSVATVSGSTVTIVGAGSAVITASQAGDGAYNVAANMSRTLTVSQKALSVTAAAQGMIYGAVVPPLTYAVSGLVNGDTAGAVLSGALVTMATSSSPAGTYLITQGTLTANANYNLAFTGANLTVVAEAGMVAWWKLDETDGIFAADSSGYGRTGILVDGPVWTSGKVGGGIWLDGINDYVLVSNAPSLNVQVVTVAAWVKLTANFNNAFVNKELSYEVGIDADGTLKAAFWTTNTTTWSWIDSDVVVGTGVWRHVATSYDGTNVMFYVDGVKVKEKPCPQGGWMMNRTYPLRLGARDVDLNGTADYFVRLSLDDVRIYNKVLTATEVAALAANGLPSPWETQDLGAVGVAGSADYSDGAFTISASGADVGGTADQFRYVYQLASGDCEIKARVVGVQNVNAGSKAGLMIRETLADNARNALMAVTAGNGVIAQWRTSTGDNTISNVTTGLTAPYWVRVVRTGTSLAAYRSLDGTTWTAMGTQSVSMATSVYIGLTLTSHTNTNTCTAVIDNVTVTP